MHNHFLAALLLLFSGLASGSTPALSFESRIKPGYIGLTHLQIDSLISQGDFESFRLRDSRTTLSFDGFDVILFSASEAVQSGMISDPDKYNVVFPDKFKLPAFHLAPNGHFTAEYTADPNIKSTGR